MDVSVMLSVVCVNTKVKRRGRRDRREKREERKIGRSGLSGGMCYAQDLTLGMLVGAPIT
jgi:hypothetical protein